MLFYGVCWCKSLSSCFLCQFWLHVKTSGSEVNSSVTCDIQTCHILSSSLWPVSNTNQERPTHTQIHTPAVRASLFFVPKLRWLFPRLLRTLSSVLFLIFFVGFIPLLCNILYLSFHFYIKCLFSIYLLFFVTFSQTEGLLSELILTTASTLDPAHRLKHLDSY